jgi:hypothetical protein
MAAEFEEIIVAADMLKVQEVGPYRRQRVFGRR